MQRGSLSPFSFALDQGEVERLIYFQLPVTYRTESDYPSYATHRESNLEPFYFNRPLKIWP